MAWDGAARNIVFFGGLDPRELPVLIRAAAKMGFEFIEVYQ
jgi:hypothetical protein